MYNTCKYQKFRQKNYKRYLYCSHPEIKSTIIMEKCYQCEYKEYENKNPIKKSTPKARTKATSITKEIREIVWERDKHKCILCGRYVPVECACCHFIPRSLGGLGIPENIFTGCYDCHREQDNGLKSKEYDFKVEIYLKETYGNKWNKDILIYKKER